MSLDKIRLMEEEYNILKNEYEILSSKKAKLFREIIIARKEIKKPVPTPSIPNPNEDMINAQFGLISTDVLFRLLNLNAICSINMVPDVFPIADDLKHRDKEIILSLSNGIKYKDIACSLGISISRTRQIVKDIIKKIKHPRVIRKLYTLKS